MLNSYLNLRYIEEGIMNSDKKHVWISSGLLGQFSSSWKMLRSAIDNAPDEYWYGKEHDWNYSRTIYHTIETQLFYIRSSPEGMEWGKIIKEINTEKKPPKEVYPSKEILIDYLGKVKKQVTTYLKVVKFEELLEKDDFKWFGSVFEKLLYLLRHNAHHIGELARMLREWGCDRVEWT